MACFVCVKTSYSDEFPLPYGQSTKQRNYRGDTFNNFLWEHKCHPELSLQKS